MMMGLFGMIHVTDSWQLGWVRLPSYWMNSVLVETREARDTDLRLVPEPRIKYNNICLLISRKKTFYLRILVYLQP